MKKLLAILAVTGFTSAFADVTVFGNFDQSMYRGTYGGQSMTSTTYNAGSASHWGLRGTEKLNGGTTASFELQSELILNTGQVGSSTTGISNTDSRLSTVFNRAAWVQLSNSDLGSIRAGRQQNAWWETVTKYNNTGVNSFGFVAAAAVAGGSTTQHLAYNGTDLSGTGKVFNFMGTSTNNPANVGTNEAFMGGITYVTPKIGNFTAKVQVGNLDQSYTTKASANNARTLALDYETDSVKVGYGWDVKQDADGNTAWTQRVIGAKYKLGQYTLTAARNETSFGSLARSQGAHNLVINAVGVGTSVGVWDYNLGYTKMSDADNSDNAVRYLGATARYNFSKTASWYVGAGQAKNSGQSRLGPVYGSSGTTIPVAGDVGKTVNAVLTGVRFQF